MKSAATISNSAILGHSFSRVLSVACVVFAVSALPAIAQTEVIDRLDMPDPITLDGTAHQLAWSSQPNPNYIKQEYVPAGQAVETYSSMLLLEVLTGDLAPIDAATVQMNTLIERKSKDPLVNMDLMQNDKSGEVFLDFIVSSKDANGEYIVEWNAYRYVRHVDRSGDKGLLFFAVSRRAYGDDNSRSFLQNLKTLRPALRNALVSSPLPDIDWNP
ncbi:hypothetical protein ABFT80_08460 [Mesorhizobium sp. SB112]|uniref:hypothetical protein n=1 Tax=Mesorhizobium sp. SB112 TaxID=3151853 RepID=UPI003263AE56